MSHSPGYIAGVTNPIFESRPIWDVLCNIETGKITINKDIRQAPLLSPTQPTLMSRTGIVPMNPDDDAKAAAQRDREAAAKDGFVAKADSADNLFMEDV